MSHLQDAAIQLAETIQTASINHNPSVERDLAPETSVDSKQPVTFDHCADVISDVETVDEDEVPLSVLRPLPDQRRAPPHLQLPDLRFEQSYLNSIREAEGWQTVAYITLKDQVLMPLSLSLDGGIPTPPQRSPERVWEPGSDGGGGKPITGLSQVTPRAGADGATKRQQVNNSTALPTSPHDVDLDV